MNEKCLGCGGTMQGREIVCGACWTSIPKAKRHAIHDAQKAVGRRPTAANIRFLDLAIADALGAVS